MIDITDLTDEQVEILLEYNGDASMLGTIPGTYIVEVKEVLKETEKAFQVYGEWSLPKIKNISVNQATAWVPKSQIKKIISNGSETVYILSSWIARAIAKELIAEFL